MSIDDFTARLKHASDTTVVEIYAIAIKNQRV
jgi:hypothetical protein